MTTNLPKTYQKNEPSEGKILLLQLAVLNNLNISSKHAPASMRSLNDLRANYTPQILL